MTEDRSLAAREQRVVIEGREKITITAVEDVDSFNENEIIFLSAKGMMTITGEDLHIARLDLEQKILVVDGEIESVDFSDHEEQRMGKQKLFGRVFK